jgi:hypothetical protein
MTPSAWIPDSCANMFVPMIDFQTGIVRPAAAATYSPSSRNRLVLNLMSKSSIHFSAMTTSSSAALPARSPRPPTVVLTHVAPAWMPAIAFAVAMPKSLCVCISISSPVSSMRCWITVKVLNGSMSPIVSQKRRRSAPCSLATRAYSHRNPSSVRDASSAFTEM